MDNFVINLDNGKYRIIRTVGKGNITFHCLRHGEPWRDLLGDKMMSSLCLKLLNAQLKPPVDDQIKEMFEQHMSEVQEEYPELTHGALTMTAAERTIDQLTDRVQRVADNRKHGHIEEVNKAFYGG